MYQHVNDYKAQKIFLRLDFLLAQQNHGYKHVALEDFVYLRLTDRYYQILQPYPYSINSFVIEIFSLLIRN